MTPHTSPNRLIHEKSPYLLQHAYNPVEWHPWGPEAFQEEDKPIFLSIGYSTCHWCHVMERESFEDPEREAALRRRGFEKGQVYGILRVRDLEAPIPDYRGLSLAKALISEGMRRLKEYDPLNLYINGAADNPGANRLYEATGFEKKGTYYYWSKTI